jgi:hypothetical protein
VRKEDVSEMLRTADPVTHEPGLSVTEVHVMRRAIVAAATDARHAGWSPWRLALAGTLAFAVVLAVFIGTVFAPGRQESAQPEATEQRQLQFETPGGTRVVWVLNSKFDLPEDRRQ